MRTLTALLLAASLPFACGGTIATIDSSQSGPDAGSPDVATDAVTGSDGTGLIDDASTTCRVPAVHRPEGAACPTTRGPGQGPYPDSGFPGNCLSDADCTMGKNGRCEAVFEAIVRQCIYDACFTDSDCAGNVACVCRASSSSVDPNFCATGSHCRVDSDCGGACGYCSPTEATSMICGTRPAVFMCHTPADECVDDTDCGGNGATCNFDPAVGHWTCKRQWNPPPP